MNRKWWTRGSGPVVIALSLIVSVGLPGCGCGGSEPVAEIDTAGDKVSFRFVCDEKLNSCGDDIGRALVVRIYELTSDSKISIMGLAQFWDNEEAELGEEFLKSTEVILDPGGSQDPEFETHRDTKVIAVIGNFCETQGECWRWVRPMDALDGRITLTAGEYCLQDTE